MIGKCKSVRYNWSDSEKLDLQTSFSHFREIEDVQIKIADEKYNKYDFMHVSLLSLDPMSEKKLLKWFFSSRTRNVDKETGFLLISFSNFSSLESCLTFNRAKRKRKNLFYELNKNLQAFQKWNKYRPNECC